MSKSQLILSIGALLLVIVIFQLPRNVVENDQLQEVTKSAEHTFDIPQEVMGQLSSLRRSVLVESDVEKKANFAHSLAMAYLDYGVLDSAVRYARVIESIEKDASRKAADIYFTAFERAPSSDKDSFAKLAKEHLKTLLDKDPKDLYLKNRLAMTLVVSENPMQGISMLREILVEDESNRQAMLNLGLLSVQSRQFEKAKERFEKLIQLDPSDHEAKIYLAVAMMELNQTEQASLLLQEILASQDSIPAIKVMAEDYLKAL